MASTQSSGSVHLVQREVLDAIASGEGGG